MSYTINDSWGNRYTYTDWELPVSYGSTSYNTYSSAVEMLKGWTNECCISPKDLRAALDRASKEIGFSISENQKAASFSPNGLEELL